MFFIIGINNGSTSLGQRKCVVFTCCGARDAMAEISCTYQIFTLLFIPLFRFGKRYFAACPQCGTIYEISKEEGRRISHDPYAEINPSQMYAVRKTFRKTCPNCNADIDPNARFCPNFGSKLF